MGGASRGFDRGMHEREPFESGWKGNPEEACGRRVAEEDAVGKPYREHPAPHPEAIVDIHGRPHPVEAYLKVPAADTLWPDSVPCGRGGREDRVSKGLGKGAGVTWAHAPRLRGPDPVV